MRRFFLLLLLFSSSLPVQAQSPRIVLEPVVAGLSSPVYITNSHDGTNRRFILEQAGRITVMQPSSTARTIFLDITSRVLSGGERGLLGLAFHPQFAANRRFFVNYTRVPDGATVIAEYRASASNPSVADNAESVILVIAQPFPNHNGGMVEFGPDGYLYVGMGDGGSGDDPGNRAQNINELLGKILRVDVSQSPYSSPPGNPFAGSISGRDEIFAIGMRNPWRFSFDRATGQLYVGDVGQNEREEVDIVVAGGNYGWRVVEGNRCNIPGPLPCSSPTFSAPILDYSHSNGRCSISGGYVYRGSQQSLPAGAYIYGDYCSGEIFIFQGGVQSVLLDTNLNIVSFGEDESGELYVVGESGSILHIANPDATTAASRAFGLADRGSVSLASVGASNLTSGYARIQAAAGNILPAGMAVFGYRPAGVLVSEASVPAMSLIQSGRIFAEVTGVVNTGIAIANPNTQAVNVSFYFTDSNGVNFGHGSTAIPANQQIAAFLNEAPFNGSSSVQGSFTFTSSLAVAAIALRGYTNERSEFLITTLPVADLSTTVNGTQTIPHFADGGGWKTEFVLVNPTDVSMSGTLQPLGRNGQSVALLPGSYSLAPRSAARISTAGTAATVQVGSLRITPSAGSGPPSAAGLFSFRANGVTVTQAGVPAVPGDTSFRMFVENLGVSLAVGSIQTGIAIANTTAAAAVVNLELFSVDGTSAGLATSVSLPANGQTALFLHEIPGFASLPARFQGVLRASSPAAITMIGLRGRYNERGDFLITTTSPVSESQLPASAELLFPHFVVGGGYEMQFVLFSSRPQPSAGTIYFFNQNGNPMSLPLR